MPTAWIEYDDAGRPLAVRWASSGGLEIEITREMAGSFMDGRENIHLYHVEESDEMMVLKKKDDHPREPAKFWSLEVLDDSSSMSILTVDTDGMTIAVDGNRPSTVLYATIKNDPSWLVRSWDLTKMPPSNGTIRINWGEADKHSFYIGVYR